MRQRAEHWKSWKQDVIASDGQYEGTIVCVEAELPPDDPWREQYARACEPLSERETIELLQRLKVRTIPRASSEDDQAFQLIVYAEDLAEYPADVARYVLSTQHKHSKWWPSWAELYQRLVLASRQREAMVVR